MKNRTNKMLALILVAGLIIQSCAEEDGNYNPLPFAVYVASKVPPNTVTFFSAVAVRKTVPDGVFRIYVNQLYDKDVVVNYAISGTAIPGEDYVPPAALNATIRANTYYAEINFQVINNPALTSDRTVVFTLTGATEGFDLGIGTLRRHKEFIYTIRP